MMQLTSLLAFATAEVGPKAVLGSMGMYGMDGRQQEDNGQEGHFALQMLNEFGRPSLRS